MKSVPVQILYLRGGQNKRNSEPYVVLIDPYQWPPRIRSKRGFERATIIYTRTLTDEEYKTHQKSWRLMSYKYTSLEKLINDEVRILGEDHEEIKVLKSFKP